MTKRQRPRNRGNNDDCPFYHVDKTDASASFLGRGRKAAKSDHSTKALSIQRDSSGVIGFTITPEESRWIEGVFSFLCKDSSGEDLM